MAADNHTTIIGNLVEDPEVRFATCGHASPAITECGGCCRSPASGW